MKEIAVLLHNVRSAHNVGAIFRTSDAVGVSRMYLSGYTPTPVDKFGRIQQEIAKTALGAEKFIPWEHAKNAGALIKRLKKSGWCIVGVEQDRRARNYSLIRANKKALYLFGNEVRGLSKSVRNACDVLIEIPMLGRKESLNVSVAAGVILFSARSGSKES